MNASKYFSYIPLTQEAFTVTINGILSLEAYTEHDGIHKKGANGTTSIGTIPAHCESAIGNPAREAYQSVKHKPVFNF